MAEYDALDHGSEPEFELENGNHPQPELQEEDEDDDYDPSFSFGNDDEAEATTTTKAMSQAEAAAQSTAQTKPRTIAGFIVDDDEDDDMEEQQDSAAAPQTYLNGMEGVQSAEATPPAADEAMDIPVASEPSQEDTAAVSSAIAQQSVPLNGSSSLLPSTSVLDEASNLAASAAQGEAQQYPVPSISAPVLQAFDTEEGKNQAQPVPSATISAIQSATATPLPPTNAVATAPAPTTESVPQTPTTQRLPHDKVGQLEDRIKEDPKADTDAWRSLIQHYREKGQLDNARKIYERMLEVFPTSAPIWTEYAAMELAQENLQAAESIFHRTLLKIPSLELWQQYLDYLRRIHPLIPDPDGSKRAIISQAFDIILENIGIDPDSGNLWRDYIDFIKSGPGVIGGSGWQDAQKVDQLRKAYQRSVRYPHPELTKLWKEYDNFELSINKQNARKFLQEHSPNYMTARAAKTQIDQRVNGLDRKSLPILPPLYGCAGEDAFATQVEKWRVWVEWEKEDPLVLKDEDVDAYRKRIVFVYRQATMCLRFYPDMWFEASAWCAEQVTEDMDKMGEEFLNNGIEACPESVLLTLKKADRVERGLDAGSTDEIAVRNGELLDPVYETVLKALYALHKKLVERMTKTIGEVREYFANLPPEEDDEVNGQDSNDEADSQAEKPLSRTQKLDEQIKLVRTAALEHQNTLKRTISYVWVAKLRAFRRIQGQGQPGKAKKGFRGVFAEARPRGQLTSEVYIANALMEWRCYQDKSADKIFERGLKLFPTDEVFALEYIKHLISNNDDTNARAVFETTMTKITNATTLSEVQKKEKSRPLLHYMHEFESNYGDLDKIHKIERRLREMFPLEPDIGRFASRFALPSFDGLAVQLIISPTQARPRTGVPTAAPGVPLPPQAIASIEEGRSPTSRLELGPHGPYMASPKRGLEDSDNETPARKYMRAESPLKGAAGRRIQSQTVAPAPAVSSSGGGNFVTKTYAPGQAGAPTAAAHPAPLPYSIHDLLNKLPAARFYTTHQFDPARIIEMLNRTALPAVAPNGRP